MTFVFSLTGLFCSIWDSSDIENTTKFVENKNILNYYLEIPDLNYFNCEFENDWPAEKRESKIISLNIKNGYIFATDSFEFELEMALFKDKTNNRDVIGAFSRACNIGGQCPPRYDFWTVERGEWENISQEIFDIEQITRSFNKENEIIGFGLPEYGTSLTVTDCETGIALDKKIAWTEGKFHF